MVLPRLDDRREDIPILASYFVQQLVKKYDKGITGIAPEALEVLASASWPGNVRQLYNVVEQSCALATTPLITLTLIQRALRVPTMEALSYADAKQRSPAAAGGNSRFHPYRLPGCPARAGKTA